MSRLVGPCEEGHLSTQAVTELGSNRHFLVWSCSSALPHPFPLLLPRTTPGHPPARPVSFPGCWSPTVRVLPGSLKQDS